MIDAFRLEKHQRVVGADIAGRYSKLLFDLGNPLEWHSFFIPTRDGRFVNLERARKVGKALASVFQKLCKIGHAASVAQLTTIVKGRRQFLLRKPLTTFGPESAISQLCPASLPEAR